MLLQLRSIVKRQSFDDLKYYALFIGYPRSGHTLVRALLDAHPNIVISNELDVLKYYEGKRKVSSKKLFKKIICTSLYQECIGNEWTDFSYAIEGADQGKSSRLYIIGDKKGGVSSRRIEKDPEILQRLKSSLPIPIRFIHVVRNPYDTIATAARRSNRTLQESFKTYEKDVESVQRIIKREGRENILTMHHEDLIKNYNSELMRFQDFFNIPVDREYLNRCATLINDRPHKSRYEVQWDRGLIQKIDSLCRRTWYLNAYEY